MPATDPPVCRLIPIAFLTLLIGGCNIAQAPNPVTEEGQSASDEQNERPAEALPSGSVVVSAGERLGVALNHIETTQYDWDGDGRLETFVLEQETDWDPGYLATRLTITPGQGAPFVIENKVEGWAKWRVEAPKQIVPLSDHEESDYLLFVRLADRLSQPPVLFLFGPAYASSFGTLDLITITGSEPKVALSEREFGISSIKDLNSDDQAEILGQSCLGEVWGPDWAYSSYVPIQIYEVSPKDGSVSLSLELSKKYNLEHYYGWAGPYCRNDPLLVLKPPDGGGPRLMSKEEADKLFEKNQPEL